MTIRFGDERVSILHALNGNCPQFFAVVKPNSRERSASVTALQCIDPPWTNTSPAGDNERMLHEDFTIDSLAAYLHLTPAQVAKLAERDRLPGRKVAGEWRFSPADIHHWLEDRLGLEEEDKLTHVEQVLDKSAPSGEAAISIADLLSTQAIAMPLTAKTRRSVIDSMAELAANTGMLWDPGAMAEAVLSREDMQPTALDSGVALLHPRRPMSNILGEPLLALGISPQGIPFGGAGGTLTDIFFLICSLEDRTHLRTLARLSRMISEPDFLTALREAEDATAVHHAIREREAEIDE